ncbi:Lif1p LALA0_S13e02520g [Lachancea lanzarotensis]|uniref:LALA0S13e02520g1_1 n=1 Tax=Lachancea lanzarotensis TaxID=1245769 RepID=A0A0C7NA76_9SACH|nr:uncharacterized protein LALA0_S13e02520g [Lachancea lanzarotensis]CEP64766.1 LALA0S13e02520g1_1 [Lachancea lanzarotensis]
MNTEGIASNEHQAQDVKSTFVSCTFASISEKVDDLSVMMCQTELVDANECITLQDFQKVSISKILASEGSDIIISENVQMDSLKCFADTSALESWCELVNFLSAGYYKAVDLDKRWAQGKRWRFYFAAPSTWTLAFETQFQNFTQRHCELAFTPAPADQELDLFHLSLELFEAQKKSNARIHSLQNQCQLLEDQKVKSQSDHIEWEARLRVRDEKTRSVVVTLLNEKKEMIRTLQERLDHGMKPLDVPDSSLMNKFVNQPVSRMTSPRKHSQIRGSGTPSPRKKAKRPIIKNETSWDDLSDKGFEFRGINRERTLTKSPSSDSSIVKGEVHQTILGDGNDNEHVVVTGVEHSNSLLQNSDAKSVEQVVKSSDLPADNSFTSKQLAKCPETTPIPSLQKSVTASDTTSDTAEDTEDTEVETDIETEVE